MQPTDLELSIFRTICWFCVFEIPLTTFDVWKWLLIPGRSYDLSEVDRAIEHSEWLSKRLIQKNGMIFLHTATAPKLECDSHRRFLDASRKYKKLRRVAHFFELIPGVEAVFAVNTLAWWHTTRESDIDLFIITSPKYVWSSRLLLVSPFAFFGNRPSLSHISKKADPFCFSFFCTSDALSLEWLQWNKDDYYLPYWIKSVVPIFDRAEVTAQLKMQNKWADRLLPNVSSRAAHPVHKPVALKSIPIPLGILEPFFRWVQRNRFPPVLRELANRDSRVVISDQMLKFHENDRRLEFIQKFQTIYETHLV